MENNRGSVLEEIFNALSHGLGFGIALVGLIAYFTIGDRHPSPLTLTGFLFFAVTMLIMYLVSILYHSLIFTRARKVFLIFDYSAIFLFIAGTYTPFAITLLNGSLGWIILSVIWILAITGIVLKAVFFNRMEKIIVFIYLCMGWLVIFAVKPLWHTLPLDIILYVVAGGVSYSFGTIFYLWKKLPFAHAIWHLFVMAGSIFHYLAIYSL